MDSNQKQRRVEHANALIQVIAAHGRRFFFNKNENRIALMEIDGRGKIWFVDDYRGRRIYTHKSGSWNRMGFSHGGTLKSLVEDMRDYIRTGQQIARWKIAPERSWTNGDIWGYGPDAAQAARDAAFVLPIMEPAK